MKRGPKPKPTALKILEGVHPFRINGNEPQFGSGDTTPPAWLAPLAREHWEELAPILSRGRVLTEADRSALAVLCDDYSLWRTDRILGHKAKDRYIRMLCEFGLTPSSRSRIKAPPEKPKDELELFLGTEKAQ